MDDNCGEWVWLSGSGCDWWVASMGVVSKRWVWLECIGVAGGCCLRMHIDFLIILLIPLPLVLALFCSSIPTSLFIFKMFFHSCLCYFCAI